MKNLPLITTKRNTYILGWVALGVLIQFFIHASIELFYMGLLLDNFDHWGFGLSWNTWFLIHHVLSLALVIAGVIIGYRQGIYWYKRMYEKGKLSHPVKF